MTKKVLRMNILGGMNDYVCNYVEDENLWEYWITIAVPDCATEDDLEIIAEADELWLDCVTAFNKIVKAENK